MQLTSFIVSVLAAGLVAPAAASPIDGGLLEARAITFPCLVTLDLTCYIKIGAICSLDPLKALLGNCKKSECERISSIWDASENKCYTPEEKCVKDGKKWVGGICYENDAEVCVKVNLGIYDLATKTCLTLEQNCNSTSGYFDPISQACLTLEQKCALDLKIWDAELKMCYASEKDKCEQGYNGWFNVQDGKCYTSDKDKCEKGLWGYTGVWNRCSMMCEKR